MKPDHPSLRNDVQRSRSNSVCGVAYDKKHKSNNIETDERREIFMKQSVEGHSQIDFCNLCVVLRLQH